MGTKVHRVKPPIALKEKSSFGAAEYTRLAFSPDGTRLAAGVNAGGFEVWDVPRAALIQRIQLPQVCTFSATWAPDSNILAASSSDKTVGIYDIAAGSPVARLGGHKGSVVTAAWSPNGKLMASGSVDRTIIVWDTETWQARHTLIAHKERIFNLVWLNDRTFLSSADSIRIWDAEQGVCLIHFAPRGGRGADVQALALSPDHRLIASGAGPTVDISDVATGRLLSVLEGHTGPVGCTAFSADGRLLVSSSGHDGTDRLWRTDTWTPVAVLRSDNLRTWVPTAAFHPRESVLATLIHRGRRIRIWEIDTDAVLGAPLLARRLYYCNAKVVLLGDSGVGKSGLALTLTGRKFAATESTHGRHVWNFSSERIRTGGNTDEQRETLLWDLAGQPGYRLIHQLHLNEVAVALVVFDARSETDPFSGVRHWDRALRQAQRVHGESPSPVRKLLVAARTDRGTIGVSRQRIDIVVKDLDFAYFLETSAKNNTGISQLRVAIRNAIDWDQIPKVSSSELFQGVKRFLSGEKRSGRILIGEEDLYRQFSRNAGGVSVSKAEFAMCIGRVESRGLIRRLTFGGLILLQPELLDSYAAAMVNAAKEEPDGLGSLAEADAKAGRFRMSADDRVKNRDQEKLLLLATVEELIRHEIALREPADDGQYLVFPSQLTRENPDLPDPEGKAITFQFEGAVSNIYSTLVVRLAHGGFFLKKDMWKDAVTYTTKFGGTFGIFVRQLYEGQAELSLFFDRNAGADLRTQFEQYVDTHLERRALPGTVQRKPVTSCRVCGFVVTDQLIRLREERGFREVNCPACGTGISLTIPSRVSTTDRESKVGEMDDAADAHVERDAGLVSAAGEMRSQSFKRWAGASASTLAIVFTDVVGSTALANEVGNEEMEKIRLVHFRRARSVGERFGGYEIKTLGDSVMMAFRTAVQALNFAISLKRSPGDPRIKLRAGIHVGAVKIQDDDAFGLMVNYASRVESHAGGDQICLSDRAAADVREEKSRAHRNLLFSERTNIELKGFPGTHTLWMVTQKPKS